MRLILSGRCVTRAVLICLLFVAPGRANPQTLPAAPAFPLKVSANGRHLTDERGEPFFYHADTGWRLFTDLTREEAEHYLEDRKRKGFTAIQAQLVVNRCEGAARTKDGQTAFLDAQNEDLSRPNDAYFEHAQWVLERAAAKNMLVGLASVWFGYRQCSYYRAMNPAAARAYGEYLGKRFAAMKNILWLHGGDCRPGSKADAVRALVAGIKKYAPKHLHTYHNGDNTASTEDFAGDDWLDVDMVESVDPPETYTRTLKAYARASPRARPVILGEPPYENERTDDFGVRSRAWWAVLSGASGHAFGVFPLWRFGANWPEAMNSPGSRQMTHLQALLRSLPWPDLKPDDKHRIVTSGYGTSGTIQFVATAATAERDLVLAYAPLNMTFRVEMGALPEPVRARWFDPTDGSFIAIAGSPFAARGAREFTPPAKNNNGDRDFVLVLEAND